ncbi:hypothetical protein HDR69_04500 [bacterium]|nr:hypothetical protein [bacterium]
MRYFTENPDEKKIDRDYIVTLQEIDGNLEVVNVPIKKISGCTSAMKRIVADESKSVQDLMATFIAIFGARSESRPFDYMAPYNYNQRAGRLSKSEFSVAWPKVMTMEKMNYQWEVAAQKAKSECERIYGNSLDIQLEELSRQKENEAVKSVKYEQKMELYKRIMRWIEALQYTATLSKLKKLENVKMYSTETIGWTNFLYKINADINIRVRTNFGYGSASYFLTEVQYKGLPILSYNKLVDYYYADMTDLIRATESFDTTRVSWEVALDYVANFVREASVLSEEEFLRRYVLTNVRKMMEGLEKINNNPIAHLNTISNIEVKQHVHTVRRMLANEIIRMQCFQEETALLFKVEKIMSALEFVGSLERFAESLPEIRRHIDRIYELNQTLLPEIREGLERINIRINGLSADRNLIDRELIPINGRMSDLIAEINRRKALNGGRNIDMDVFRREFPDYDNLLRQQNNLYVKRSDLTKKISELSNFASLLTTALANTATEYSVA